MGSFLVIGMGRFGSSVATELYRMKHDVLVIDEREDKVSGLINNVTEAVIGDAKDEAVLRSLDVYSFDAIIITMASSIEDSILTTIMLKEMGAKMLVCKARNEWHAKVLAQIGADRVINPESDMGKRLANSLARRNIMDYLEISSDYGVLEITAPANWVNKSLSKNNLRRKYKITVMAIHIAQTDEVIFSPGADVVLREGDALTLIGAKQALDSVSALK